ncbi:hypothetical protein [Modestobacter sp. SYSU DS0657]
MSRTAPDGHDHRRSTPEQALAPHLEPDWVQEFVLELRLRGVGGGLIGEALSEADAHCADSGAGAGEVFGDPVAYARTLDLPVREDQTSTTAMLGAMAPTGVQVAGALLLVNGVLRWRLGQDVGVTVGLLADLALLLVLGLVLARFSEPLLRGLVRHPLVAGAVFALVVTATTVPLLLLDGELAQLSAPLATAAGGAVLLAGAGWELAQHRRGGLDDPITPPLGRTGPDGAPEPGAGGRWSSPLLAVGCWTALSLAAIWWS